MILTYNDIFDIVYDQFVFFMSHDNCSNKSICIIFYSKSWANIE